MVGLTLVVVLKDVEQDGLIMREGFAMSTFRLFTGKI